MKRSRAWLWILGATLLPGLGFETVSASNAVSADGDAHSEWRLAPPGMSVSDLGLSAVSSGGIVQEDVDPGEPVEGDYMGRIAFTPDGSRAFLTNRLTDNVSVYDVATNSLITNIPVGISPGGVAASDEHVVVACGFSDEVYVLDVDTYATLAVFPTGEQPWEVRINPDGSRAFVACDVDDLCHVFDLDLLSAEYTISDFPFGIVTFAFITENARSTFRFNEFRITPDGTRLVVDDFQGGLRFYDTADGSIADTLPVANAWVMDFSGDGSTLVALDRTSNPGVMYQIDWATPAVTASATGPAGFASFDVGVNGDGTKAYTGISGNQSALFRFATSDAVTFSSTFSAFWVGTTADHTHAVSGQSNFALVNFAAESIAALNPGAPQSYGVVSSGDRVFACDPLRNEGVYPIDVSNPSAPVRLAELEAGEDPEGDAPRRIALSQVSGQPWTVVSNVLSGNVSIAADGNVQAILPVGDRVQSVAITSDGTTAVACGMESGAVSIIDLPTQTVLANVPTGTRPAEVVITPDDQFAYVANIVPNTVSVVELNGAASSEIAELPVGTIGTAFFAYGVNSGLAMSPTGDYVLVAASFTNRLTVIDTATNTVVASLVTGTFPIRPAFNAAGDRALVTNYNGNSVTFVNVDGAASSVITTTPTGGRPVRLDYNPFTDEFGVTDVDNNRIVRIDGSTGAFAGSISYTGFGTLIQALHDGSGGWIALTSSDGATPGHVHTDVAPGPIALPAVPSFMAVAPTRGRIAVAMPGPDFFTLISYDAPVSAPVVEHFGRDGLAVSRPHPVTTEATLGFTLAQESTVDVSLFDVAGRRVSTLTSGRFPAGEHVAHVNANSLTAGVYFAVLRANGVAVARQKVVRAGS